MKKCIKNLFLLMLLLAPPATVQAQFTFTTNNGAITITGYTGADAVVTIPSTTNGYPITTIGDGVESVFSSAYPPYVGVTSVTIPASVTSIGYYAFGSATSLTNIVIPNSVTSIGGDAFGQCFALASITIGNSVTSIGNYAFSSCPDLTAITVEPGNPVYNSVGGVLFGQNLTTLIQYPALKAGTSYTVPNSVTSLGVDAFEGCASLTNVTIPSSVTTIGDEAFAGCASLTAIMVSATNSAYSSMNGVLFNKSHTMLIQYPGGIAAGGYTIPNSVTTIGDEAFYASTLTSITIPDSVTTIGGLAFDGCDNLTSVTIPNSVTTIAESAFQQCYGLTSVTIGNGIAIIGSYAFFDCTNLTSVTIGNGVTSIGDWAFSERYENISFYFQGNAPIVDYTVFSEFANAYYLPGTTGWGAFTTDTGVPAEELNFIIFSASPSYGVVPITVNFTSPGVDSAGNSISSWNWTFGDGAISPAQNPSHTYTTTGDFSVGLLATNNAGVQVIGEGPLVTVVPLTVAFTANTTDGLAPLTVQFNSLGVDILGNAIAHWNWNFGDGSTSTAQNPSHTYSSVGTFSPALVATNNIGATVTGVGPSSITVTNAPVYSGLVLNGDFETGDFTGWTLSGDTSYSSVGDVGIDGGPPYSGNYTASLLISA